MATLGGAWSILASAGLALRLVLIDELEGPAPWVVGLAALAGAVAIAGRSRYGALVAADLLLVVALLPAVFGWIPLLFLPGLVLMAVGTIRAGIAVWEEE